MNASTANEYADDDVDSRDMRMLQRQAVNEFHFFRDHAHEGIKQLYTDGLTGTSKLIDKINDMFLHYLCQVWMPRTISKLRHEHDGCHAKRKEYEDKTATIISAKDELVKIFGKISTSDEKSAEWFWENPNPVPEEAVKVLEEARQKKDIDVIVAVMAQHRDSTEVQEKGCNALGSVAYNNAATRRTIAEKGGIEAVFHAMTQHSHHEGVQKWGCCVMCRMVYLESARPAIRKGKAVMDAARNNFPNDSSIQTDLNDVYAKI